MTHSDKSRMYRMLRYRPDLTTLLLIGLAIYFWFRPPAWVSEQATATPSFSVQLVDHRSLGNQSLLGKVVLINFWATWCPFCRHEMPAMEEFYQDYQNKGFEILAISIESDAALIAQFMKDEGYTFPAAVSNATVSKAFGSVNRVPLSFILDKQGVIRHKIVGQVHYARLHELVTPLLNE